MAKAGGGSRDRGDVRTSRRALAMGVCATAAFVFAGAGVASAADYGYFVEVETEEDLLDLYSANQIDETAFQTLRELLHDPVDLATASREELYRLPNLSYADVDGILAHSDASGGIQDLDALVSTAVLTERKLDALRAFIVPIAGRDADGKQRGVSGRIGYKTTTVIGDQDAPSMALVGTLQAHGAWEFGGAAVLTRTRLGEVTHDATREALTAEPATPAPHVPKFYAQWKTPVYHVVAGTFRIGFGQRLTLDNSSQYTPNGIQVDNAINYSQDLTGACKESQGELDASPCTGAAGERYMSPDYGWSERMRGVAVGIRRLAVGKAWMQAYAFGSYESHSLYQYELYDRTRCDDPLDDADDACKSPLVYKTLSDPDELTSRYSYQTLPNIYSDAVVGGNVSVFRDGRTHLGVTGYFASVQWAVDNADMKLDFQEWSRLPYGGPFGAVGVDGAWGYDRVDVFFEVSRSLDEQPAGGGWGAITRSTLTSKDHELEASLRYYDRDFANPYARPIAAADEYDGLRARDEAGLRFKYAGSFGALQLRAAGDAWMRKRAQDESGDDAPEANVVAGHVRVGAAYQMNRRFEPGLWLEYSDKDLSDSGRGNCFETAASTLLDGEPPYCQGEKLQGAVQLAVRPSSVASIIARFQYRLIDDGKAEFADAFREDMSAYLVGTWRARADLRLRARAAYNEEAIGDDSYLDKIFTAYTEASYNVGTAWWLKVRYQYYDLLDERAGTLAREPNPSHWLRLELEARL